MLLFTLLPLHLQSNEIKTENTFLQKEMNRTSAFRSVLKELPKNNLMAEELSHLVGLGVSIDTGGQVRIGKIGDIFEKYGEEKINELKSSFIPKYSGNNKIWEMVVKNFSNLANSLYVDLDLKNYNVLIRRNKIGLYVPEIDIGDANFGINPIYDPKSSKVKTGAHFRSGDFGVNFSDLSEMKNFDVFYKRKVGKCYFASSAHYGGRRGSNFTINVIVPLPF